MSLAEREPPHPGTRGSLLPSEIYWLLAEIQSRISRRSTLYEKYSRTLYVLLATALVVVACASESDPVGGEAPADPDTPITTIEIVDFAPLPLPPPVGEQKTEALDNGNTRVWPNSAEVIDAADYKITVYTHCGFEHIDFDESF
jgi:hypothetical protein